MKRSTKTLEERFWPKVDRRGDHECWPWLAGLTSYGYGQIQVQSARGWSPEKASRVAYKLTHGRIPEGAHILHSCDNPPCCNPAHLRAGTAADNMQEKSDRGRARGGRPKLTADDVREIRKRAAGGERQTHIARDYGLDQSAVSLIVSRRNWKWVV